MGFDVGSRGFDPADYQVAVRMGGAQRYKARRWSILKNGINIPHCTRCYSKMLRWSWYEAPNASIEYWYCLDCDVAGRTPYIFVLPARDKSKKEGVA